MRGRGAKPDERQPAAHVSDHVSIHVSVHVFVHVSIHVSVSVSVHVAIHFAVHPAALDRPSKRSGPDRVLSLGGGRVSILVRPHTLRRTVVLVATVLVLALLAIALGTRWLPLREVIAGLAGQAESTVNLTVREFRLPRVAVGILVGVALGTSGAGEHVVAVALAVAVLLPLALLMRRSLDAMQLGDDSAVTLGVPVARVRFALFIVAFALAGTAVAAAGAVAFVALLAPQLARRITKDPGTPLLASALIGAALLLTADLLARHLAPGTELPAGAVTALIGAPALLVLLLRMGEPQ